MNGGHRAKDEPAARAFADGLGGDKVTCHVSVDSLERQPHRRTVIAQAPGFVVPNVFSAWFDLPSYPTNVTLHIEARTSGQRVAMVELHPFPNDLLFLGVSSIEAPMADDVPALPPLPVPSLKRRAIAVAAMPADRPDIEEMGKHVEAVLDLLPITRSRRISDYDRYLIRHYYSEALSNPSLMTKYERREYVFEALHAENPRLWPRGDGRTPDYDRIRPFLAELDRERGLT